MRVIGPDSEQLGILQIKDALQRAQEAGLDLVEVAPTSSPPVCRIIDYGKYRYELAKKQHGAKQKSAQLKEVKLRPFTDTHDLEFKMRHAKAFLAILCDYIRQGKPSFEVLGARSRVPGSGCGVRRTDVRLRGDCRCPDARRRRRL